MADVVVLGREGRGRVLRTPALPGRRAPGHGRPGSGLGSLRTDTWTEGWA